MPKGFWIVDGQRLTDKEGNPILANDVSNTLFQKVETDEESGMVRFTLADGSTFEIPVFEALSIRFDAAPRNGRPRPFDTGRNRIHRSGQRSRNGVCRLLHGMERNGENRQIHPYDLGEAGRKCRRRQCRRHRLGRRQYRSQTIILHLWNGPDRPSDVGSAVRNGSGGRPRRRIHGIRHQGVGQHRL